MESYSKEKRTKQRTMIKKDSQLLHAKKRCRERCGINLNEECYSYVLRAIHGEEVEGIELEFNTKQSARVEHYTIRFGNMKDKYNVVYDCDRDVIVTFLPVEDFQRIYHYTNWIGNVINLKNQHHIVLKFKDKELTGDYLTINKVDENTWHIEDINKTLQLREGKLYEV